MTPPIFWFNSADKPGWKAHALAPLGALYAHATARRVAQAGYKSAVPVLCIGNINAGGTGKTPTVIALIQLLQSMGKTVHVVSRGYGGTLTGPIKVDERVHSVHETGDEPLLIAAFTSTWVSKDRAAGVRTAEAAGAEVILLDDGMQNPTVQKDATLIIVDAARGFGNGRVMPAGPLREPVDVGMKRGDLLVTIGDQSSQDIFTKTWGHAVTVPRIQAQLEPLKTGMQWDGLRALAFAGIGHPEKFFTTLRTLGVELIATEALRDHQPLSRALMKRLELEAAGLNAQMVTTEKDAVRLPHEFRTQVLTVPVRLTIEDEAPIKAILAQIEAL
jgi:tetraacyldisaccharide 4'-kinase